MTHKQLFNKYQNMLDWINRRLEPDSLEFYEESAETWKHAKEVAFDMYEELRYHVRGGIPEANKSFFYDKDLVESIPDYEDQFPAIGILKYRDNEYTIYNDDYGMQSFIVVDGQQITVDSFGGGIDWWYMLDQIIDKIF